MRTIPELRFELPIFRKTRRQRSPHAAARSRICSCGWPRRSGSCSFGCRYCKPHGTFSARQTERGQGSCGTIRTSRRPQQRAREKMNVVPTVVLPRRNGSSARIIGTKRQKENRVVCIYNAVFVRSEADLNRCSSFCRAVPSHSAIRPFIPRRSGDPPVPLRRFVFGRPERRYVAFGIANI